MDDTPGSEPSPEDEDVKSLHKTVEELQRENEALRAAEVSAGKKGPGRVRRVLAWVLVVVACILAIVSVVIVFGRNELLNTDSYVNTVAPLASNPAIQTEVATRVSNTLIAKTDLSDRVKSALPPKAGFLVTPITSEVKSVAYSITLKLVESDEFQKLWVAANRASHKQLVAVLTGSTQGSVSTKNGKVTVDLSQVETQVKKRLDQNGITVFNKVPAVKGLNVVLFQSDQLVRFQRVTRLLNKVALILPILTLLIFAAGVILTRDRRRGLVRAAVGLTLSMGLMLIVISVARNQYLNSLSPSQSKAANAAVIDTVSAPLQDTIRATLFLALLIAVIALLAGIPSVRRWVTGREQPTWLAGGRFHDFLAAHRRGLQWASLGIGLFVLVVWDKPTTRVAVIVVLITLAVIGLVGLLAGRRPHPAAAGLGTGDGARSRADGAAGARRVRSWSHGPSDVASDRSGARRDLLHSGEPPPAGRHRAPGFLDGLFRRPGRAVRCRGAGGGVGDVLQLPLLHGRPCHSRRLDLCPTFGRGPGPAGRCGGRSATTPPIDRRGGVELGDSPRTGGRGSRRLRAGAVQRQPPSRSR